MRGTTRRRFEEQFKITEKDSMSASTHIIQFKTQDANPLTKTRIVSSSIRYDENENVRTATLRFPLIDTEKVLEIWRDVKSEVSFSDQFTDEYENVDQETKFYIEFLSHENNKCAIHVSILDNKGIDVNLDTIMNDFMEIDQALRGVIENRMLQTA